MGVRGMRRRVMCAPESGRVDEVVTSMIGARGLDGTRWPAYEARRARP
jgi:hypothetical protein